jgi:hypothetical protein
LHSLFIDSEGSLAWTICKAASAATVVGIGFATWQYWRVNASRHFNAKLLRLGAIWLIALAAASAAWTFHLARVTGDFEAWVILINVAMIGQAALMFWQLWNDGHRTLAAR